MQIHLVERQTIMENEKCIREREREREREGEVIFYIDGW